MENKNNTIFTTLIVLVVGLIAGYLFGMSNTKGAPQMTHRMPDGSHMSGSDMHATMDGMMMSLEGKTGEALEKAFLDEMIVHHEGAIEMAQVLLKGTSRPELVKLGNDIITAQTGEIQMMKKWRMEWFLK